MKTLKGWITTTVIAILLTPTLVFADGIVVGNRSGDSPGVPCIESDEGLDWGIVVGNFTGVVVGNLTGIVIATIPIDTADEACGVVVGN